jgi:hypothetical protein
MTPSTKAAIYVPGDTGEVSDGYHTFNELYEHRHALFLAVGRLTSLHAWKSWTHSDGKGIEGWFLAGIDLPTGTITYHLPERLWDSMPFAEELDSAPEWDGHTSSDVVNRLFSWVKP